jgi:hypothetical protein
VESGEWRIEPSPDRWLFGEEAELPDEILDTRKPVLSNRYLALTFSRSESWGRRGPVRGPSLIRVRAESEMEIGE